MPKPLSGKNFRLPDHVRPARYTARLSLDLQGGAFAGSEVIDLVLGEPVKEIVLHAVDLEIRRVTYRVGGRSLNACWEIAPESQTVILRLPETLPAGTAKLEIDWAGRFSSGLRGLYRAGPMAVTQFEAADARRVFPCLDEPGFKAPWSIALEVPRGVVALANGIPAVTTPVGERVQITYGETPPIATYLVALACGQMESTPSTTVRGVPVRTWTAPGKLALTSFAHSVAVEVLPRLEDYFGLPYAFGKLDQLAVPDFEAGAMENAGLITYRETAMLLDPVTGSLAQKKRIAEVITHELSHQWFGNWVTMEWWDDLWLNEAFATWIAFKIVDSWQPSWRVWLEFDAGKAVALRLDALRSTHPIRADVRNADEATESFDAITYEKGGAVLRMFESFLGEGPFREGIRSYIHRYGRTNATASDLWGALAASSSEPVAELAKGWIEQAGYPLVRVERQGRRLDLQQQRFFSEPDESPTKEQPTGVWWPVPLIIRFADAQGTKEHRFLLRDRKESVDLPAEGEVSWIFANGGTSGFYRVSYTPELRAALDHHLDSLTGAERGALLDDEWALVRAAQGDVASFLDHCWHFRGEEDYSVLNELADRLATIEHRLEPQEARVGFRERVAELFNARFEKLGWDAASDEPDEVRLKRAALVRAVGLTARTPAVISEAERRLDRFLAGDRTAIEPNLLDAVVFMSARVGDPRRFDALWQQFQVETDPAIRKRFLLSLAAFEDPVPAGRAQQMIFDERVPLQDFSSFVTFLLTNRTTREPFWRAIRERWPQLEARIAGAPMLLRRTIEAIGQLTERRHLKEAETFLAAHPIDAARQAIAQTLERLRQDVALFERLRPAISQWISRNWN